MKNTIAIILLTFGFNIVSFSATLDTKSMVGTFVLNPKKVDEKGAIGIAESLSKNKSIKRLFVRHFRDVDTWAIDMELSHEGTRKSFKSAVSKIEESIEKKYGKETIRSKYVASSVTWIKK